MKNDAVLTWNTTGITLRRMEKGKGLLTTTVAWRDITGVTEFKADLGFVDLLCMAIFTENGEFEINEQMEGWEKLIEELPTYLPGFPHASSWFDRVAQPPFSTNFTRLYPIEEIPLQLNQELN